MAGIEKIERDLISTLLNEPLFMFSIPKLPKKFELSEEIGSWGPNI